MKSLAPASIAASRLKFRTANLVTQLGMQQRRASWSRKTSNTKRDAEESKSAETVLMLSKFALQSSLPSRITKILNLPVYRVQGPRDFWSD